MGNICRSPTAQGVFARLVEDYSLSDSIEIDSAGTHAYHIGEQPDARASAAALNRGIDLSSQQARRVSPDDFERFDYVLAMKDILPRKHTEKHGRIDTLIEIIPCVSVTINTRTQPIPEAYSEATFLVLVASVFAVPPA
jgi:protein-tyrosine-phosphatase